MSVLNTQPSIRPSKKMARLLAKLDGVQPSGKPREFRARCPGARHAPHAPARLTLAENNALRRPDGVWTLAENSAFRGPEGVWLHCHEGCSVEEILAALDLTLTDLYPPHLEWMASLGVPPLQPKDLVWWDGSPTSPATNAPHSDPAHNQDARSVFATSPASLVHDQLAWSRTGSGSER